MNTCIRAVLIPLASANIMIRRDMEKTANFALDRIEEKVNSIMQRSIDVVITWVTRLLGRQNKSDFRPRDDALGGGSAWLEQLQTPVVPMSSLCSSIHTLTPLSDQLVHLSIPNTHPQSRPYSPLPVAQPYRIPHRAGHHVTHLAPRALQKILCECRGRYHGYERY